MNNATHAATSKTRPEVPASLIDDMMRLAAQGHVSGWHCVIGWFQVSPRKGRYGIRFQPEPKACEIDGVAFSPVAHMECKRIA